MFYVLVWEDIYCMDEEWKMIFEDVVKFGKCIVYYYVDFGYVIIDLFLGFVEYCIWIILNYLCFEEGLFLWNLLGLNLLFLIFDGL